MYKYDIIQCNVNTTCCLVFNQLVAHQFKHFSMYSSQLSFI